MVKISITALALAAILAASPAAAQKDDGRGPARTRAPEAADQTLGMALMSANVSYGCNHGYGSGLIGLNSPGAGACVVTFDRDIRRCTAVASLGLSLMASTAPGSILAYVSADHGDAVIVETRDVNGDYADYAFSALVFCAQ
ncbi:hypothetical protein [Microbaculum marinum]|uniref:Secreted protein n=1 Tax=Microbaculum marinum TaxID=1764581 RepID=A0AAW9RJZ7_9HYPH